MTTMSILQRLSIPGSAASARSSKNNIFTEGPSPSPPPPPNIRVSTASRSRQNWRRVAHTTLEDDQVRVRDPDEVSSPYSHRPRITLDRPIPLSSLDIKPPINDIPDKAHSRTSSFFDQRGSLSPWPSSSLSPSLSTASLTHTHSSSPSLHSPLPVSPSYTDDEVDIELKYTLDGTSFLGSGRSSNVYLGAYRPRRGSSGTDPNASWKICAVKRLNEDEESQSLGIREAWFLRHLADDAHVPPHSGKKHVISLLALMVEEASLSDDEASQRPLRRASSLRSSSSALKQREIGHTRTISSPVIIPPTTESRPLRRLLLLPYAAQTLSSLIHTSPHLLTPRTFTTIARQLCLALQYTHLRGVFHTDVKPLNVLLAGDSEDVEGEQSQSVHVLLADFNNSLHLPSTQSMTRPIDPVGLGTPAYAPKEYFRRPDVTLGVDGGKGGVGFPADVFSLGVTLMTALLGREPYARLTARSEAVAWLANGYYWLYEERERTLHHDIHDDSQNQAGNEYSYPDGSPAMYFLGLGAGETRRTRVPDELFMLLKRMCAPAPESRPDMDAVVATLENIQNI